MRSEVIVIHYCVAHKDPPVQALQSTNLKPPASLPILVQIKNFKDQKHSYTLNYLNITRYINNYDELQSKIHRLFCLEKFIKNKYMISKLPIISIKYLSNC